MGWNFLCKAKEISTWELTHRLTNLLNSLFLWYIRTIWEVCVKEILLYRCRKRTKCTNCITNTNSFYYLYVLQLRGFQCSFQTMFGVNKILVSLIVETYNSLYILETIWSTLSIFYWTNEKKSLISFSFTTNHTKEKSATSAICVLTLLYRLAI